MTGLNKIIEPIINIIGDKINVARIYKNAKVINAMEKDFNYSSFEKSARYCFNEFRKITPAEAELIAFPADGKTIYHDVKMQIGWEGKTGILAVTGPEKYAKMIIADRKKNLNTLVCWSPATPPGGIEADVITDTDFKNGISAENKIILFQPGQHPKKDKKKLCDQGALGVVCAPLKEWHRNLNGINWINAWSDGPGWYAGADEKYLPCFSIKPKDLLRLFAIYDQEDGLRLKMTITSSIKKSLLYNTTCRIKGSVYPEKELLVFAHTNEPQPSDDAVGEALVIECAFIMKTLIAEKKIACPKCSIRFMLGNEHVGLSAYYSINKNKIKDTIAGVNLDTTAFACERYNNPHEVKLSSQAAPSIFDALYLAAVHASARRNMPDIKLKINSSHIHDDCLLSDPFFNIPMYWTASPSGRFWHNSLNSFSQIPPGKLKMTIERDLSFIYAVANSDDKILNNIFSEYKTLLRPTASSGHMDTDILNWRNSSAIASLSKHPAVNKNTIRKMLKAADGFTGKHPAKNMILEMYAVKLKKIVPVRLYEGVLHGYARIPHEIRTTLLKTDIHLMRTIHSYLDGKRNLYTVLKFYLADDFHSDLDNKDIENLLLDFKILKKYRYIKYV